MIGGIIGWNGQKQMDKGMDGYSFEQTAMSKEREMTRLSLSSVG